MATKQSPCQCRRLARKSAAEKWPIVHDENLEEFYLLASSEGDKSKLRFCPWCGDKLPRGKRLRFDDVQMKKVKELRAKLGEVESIEEIENFLGSPEHDFNVSETDEDAVGHSRQLTYHYEDIVVWVTFEENGEWKISYAPGEQ